MSQRIISLDSQILNSIQLCARRTEYSFIQNLQPPTKAEALERGSLLHTLLEIYDSFFLPNGPEMDNETWKLIAEAGFTIPTPSDDSKAFIARAFAIETGRMFASRMSLPLDVMEETMFQFSEYTKFFEHDGWNVMAVEAVGSKVLFESSDLKIIYNFKIDKVAQKGDLTIPWDYKSSSKRQEISSLSNQFMGYAWGLDTNSVMIVKVGFQKTLKPSERFERHILQYSPNRINEWIANSIHWAEVLLNYIEKDAFPMNLTSCDKYSGCIYRTICDKDPVSREWEIEKHFKIGEGWDVASVLK